MVRLFRNSSVILSLSLFTVLMAITSLPSSAQDSPRKQLLVLHSYHKGYKWTDDITEGIESTLRTGDKNFKIHYEYMDTKRVSDETYYKHLYDIYKYKFSRVKFDVIVSSDNDAFDFLVKYRDDLFPGTPVVFCGVNYFNESMLNEKKLFTGVNEETDPGATIDLALRLHPDTRQIVVINDTTTTGLAMHKRLMELLPRYQKRVRFTFLDDVAMPELLTAVQRLSPDTLVLYVLFIRDRSGRFFDYDESISMIAKQCKVPIYGLWDFNLGYGIVGGMLTSGYYQGVTAAKMAIRILHGEKVRNIPIVMKSPNRYMFDFMQLKRFGLAFSPLPEGSIVLNQPSPAFSVPRKVLWSTAAAIAILAVTVLYLLPITIRHKRAKESLQESLEQIQDSFEQAPVGIARVGTDGRWLLVNQRLCQIVGYPKDELTRLTASAITHPDDLDAEHECLHRLLAGEIRTCSMNKRYIRRDGSPTWVHLTSSLVREASGEPKYFIIAIEKEHRQQDA